MKQIWQDIKERWPLAILGAIATIVSLYLAF